MQPGEEILILILADLGTDHRCFKVADTVKKLGYIPTLLCDRPRTPIGPLWDQIELRILTRESHYNGFIAAFIVYMWRVTPILLATRSPVWIIEDGTPLLWAALIGKLRAKRVIYDAREILLETPMIRNRLSRRLFWFLWIGLGMRLTDRMATVSPSFVQYFQSRYPEKNIFLLPNVPKAWKQVDSEKPPVTFKVQLVYQGALRAGSGLREALEAIAQAPEYSLSIYGFGPEEALLKELTERLGLKNRVTFYGAIPFELLREPIAKAHIGLHLLEPSCISFDLTLSNKIFDYIHGLTPVLMGRTAAHKAFLEKEPVGVMVASLSTADILNALETIRASYPEFQTNCRSARLRWVWEEFEPGFAGLIGRAPVHS